MAMIESLHSRKLGVKMTEQKSLLQIGLARADITPPVGIAMVGFAGRGPSIGQTDPLFATALVFKDEKGQAVMIACDLLGLSYDVVTEIRQEISSRTDIQPSNITISCTHTHYGPDSYRDESAPDVTAYRTNLKYKLAGMVQEACNSFREIEWGVAWGASDIGINRREKLEDGRIVLGKHPEGPIDRQVGVLRIDDAEGNPVASCVNFACHPVSQGGGMQLISADFPGRMRDVVEQLTGVPCLYLQGACGNINPIRMEHSYHPARSLGTRLGCEVVKVWETIQTEEETGLATVSKTVGIPQMMYGSESEAETLVSELTRQLEQLQTQGGAKGSIYWVKRRLERAKQALESWRSGEPVPTIDVELQAWRLGNLGCTTAPGEVFNEIGTKIKQRSSFKNTFFLGYTNGSIGYVPTEAAYPEGGYEVTHACRVNKEAAGIITEGCLELLHGLSI